MASRGQEHRARENGCCEMLRWLTLCVAFANTSCAQFPRDPDSTLERVQNEGSYRVGVMTLGRGAVRPEVVHLLRRISSNTHASPEVSSGDSEVLLRRLEEGSLDLVIGRFEKSSPWAQRVTIGPKLRRVRQGKAEWHLAPAMRNGENAWIALVEREARNTSPALQ